MTWRFPIARPRQSMKVSETRVALIGAAMLTLGPVSSSLFAPALPSVVGELNTTEAKAQLAISALLGGLAIAQLLCGALSDRFGRKSVLSAFFAIFIAASFWASVAQDIDHLIAARFFQGIGASAGLITSRAIVRDLFPPERATRIYALMSGAIAVGPAIAPFAGALLVVAFGWRATLLVLGLLALLVVVLTVFGLPESNRGERQPLRFGTVITSLILLLRTGSFVGPALVAAIPTGTMYAFAAITPLLLIVEIGVSTSSFGLILMAQAAVYILATIVCRLLIGRMSVSRVALIGISLDAAGAIGLILLHFQDPLTVVNVMVPIALISFGNGLFFPMFTSQSIYGAPTGPGMASSVLNFLQLSTGFIVTAGASLLADARLAAGTVYPLCIMVAVGLGVLHLSRGSE